MCFEHILAYMSFVLFVKSNSPDFVSTNFVKQKFELFDVNLFVFAIVSIWVRYVKWGLISLNELNDLVFVKE